MGVYIVLSIINLVIESLALCLGVVTLSVKKIDKNFKTLLWFLLVTFLIESFSTFLYFNKDLTGIDNVLGLYNLYGMLTFGIFFYLYDNLLKNVYTKLIIGFYIIYLVIVLIEAVYSINFGTENLTFSQILASLFLSITVILYFTTILKSGTADSLFSNIYFWLSAGLLLYYTGHIPFRAVINYFTFGKTITFLFFNIQVILRIIMFILIVIGAYRHLRHS